MFCQCSQEVLSYSLILKMAGAVVSIKMRLLLLLLVAVLAVVCSEASANLGGVPSKRLKMKHATRPLLKFQIVCPEGAGKCLRSTCRLLGSGIQTSSLKERIISLNQLIDT